MMGWTGECSHECTSNRRGLRPLLITTEHQITNNIIYTNITFTVRFTGMRWTWATINLTTQQQQTNTEHTAGYGIITTEGTVATNHELITFTSSSPIDSPTPSWRWSSSCRPHACGRRFWERENIKNQRSITNEHFTSHISNRHELMPAWSVQKSFSEILGRGDIMFRYQLLMYRTVAKVQRSAIGKQRSKIKPPPVHALLVPAALAALPELRLLARGRRVAAHTRLGRRVRLHGFF